MIRRALVAVAGVSVVLALGASPASAEPPTGNPSGTAAIPPEAAAVDTSNPDIVIGDGTPASCTSAAVVAAVAQGGVITFDCGPDPVVIEMDTTAKVFNDTGPEIVIDGGGLVTLSGKGERRILYMNTCDPAQVWTTSHCQNQDHPRLTVQNLTFVDGDATGDSPEGGGAIFVRGGRFKIVNSRFFRNRCDPSGPDVAGGAVYVLSQYQGLPVYVTSSTFGGEAGYGNVCSNGGGIGSIGVSWTIINSLFTHNDAIGWGANPARSGTPGGGNGGAIANDGNTYTLDVRGTRIHENHASEGGGAIFYVSNDRTGSLVISDSELRANPSDGFETNGYPGVFVLASGPPQVTNSVISDELVVIDLCPAGATCDTITLHDTSGRFHRWSAIATDRTVDSFYFGNPGDAPMMGDWDCDGVDTPGLYRRSDGYVYLRNANTQGVADIRFFFGNPGDVPLAGDFDGDGCDTVSIWRPSEGRVFVINELGANDGGLGPAEFDYYFGNPGDEPFVGDFDGDGIDTVGLHRGSTGLVYFRNSHTQGVADAQFIYGDPGDRIVAGDWDGDGDDTVAVYRPSDGRIYVKTANIAGRADATLLAGAGFDGIGAGH